MNYISKAKELRKIIPIPINEALVLLKRNRGDLTVCVEQFKDESIQIICKTTGCDKDMASLYYNRENFDLNRSISMIQEDLYDLNYQPIKNLTLENLNKVREWIAFTEEKDFANALDYKYMKEVIETLLMIPKLKHFGIATQQAYKIKREVFNGYSDDLSIEEFIKRNVKLDNDEKFRTLYDTILLSLIPLKEEINRHRRNMNK